MKKVCMALAILFAVIVTAYSNNSKTDANIVGHITCNGEHLPFVSITLKGTTIGTVTDNTGHYQLVNLPLGQHTVVVSALGFKSQEQTVNAEANNTIEIKFNLEEDVLGLEEVVITGDRKERRRTDAPVIVSSISGELFQTAQTTSISEGLNFVPGLRTENNCSNCGFVQVRMNGMEGPYSQVLINNRPIFSGLAGVYGLELIPSSMIERVEVVRGGGSAIYGSNAIAGTVNLILKDPIRSSYEVSTSAALVGVGLSDSDNPAKDYTVDFNTSYVTDDLKSGIALFGFYRDREPFDANGDDFSELTQIKNTTVGTRFFRRFGHRSKVAVDFFNIKENRRGGNKFDYIEHQADIAEAVRHNITTGAVTYERFFRELDLFSVYASSQYVDRDSYYGAGQSLADYGKTKDLSYNVGTQYVAQFGNLGATLGAEVQGSNLNDTKLGYQDIENAVIINDTIQSIPHTNNTTITDQSVVTYGLFAQFDYSIGKLDFSVGARFDKYDIKDHIYDPEHTPADKSGNVFSPRVTLKYDILKNLQARLSYSKGYRAPQIFDEDLHILTSEARKVLHQNDADLKEETSHSYMGSLNYNYSYGNFYISLLGEAFYTALEDAFANEPGELNEKKEITYTRINAEGTAVVQGINFEMNMIPFKDFRLDAGMTFQKSAYDQEIELGEKSFFRSPDNYGYVALDWDFIPGLCLSSTMNYTGKMLVPYYGPTLPDPEAGELRKSDPFYDFGLKLRYTIDIDEMGIQFFGGVKNIFNAYQEDLDIGEERDPGYIYGPGNPRTVYFGIKIGNNLLN